MAKIGTLGDIVFSVSRNKVNTFSGMKRDSTAQYATHNRHLKDSLLEYTGADADKISFNMYFSVFLGVEPMSEIKKLNHAKDSGKIMRLVIGGKTYGKHKWVITKLSEEFERFAQKGKLLSAKVNVQLTAYSRR